MSRICEQRTTFHRRVLGAAGLIALLLGITGGAPVAKTNDPSQAIAELAALGTDVKFGLADLITAPVGAIFDA